MAPQLVEVELQQAGQPIEGVVEVLGGMDLPGVGEGGELVEVLADLVELEALPIEGVEGLLMGLEPSGHRRRFALDPVTNPLRAVGEFELGHLAIEVSDLVFSEPKTDDGCAMSVGGDGLLF